MEWTRSQERERWEAAAATKMKEAEASKFGLRVTLFVWILIVIGIFYFIGHTVYYKAGPGRL